MTRYGKGEDGKRMRILTVKEAAELVEYQHKTCMTGPHEGIFPV